MLRGYATDEGTAHYKNRFPELNPAGHFRHAAFADGLSLSSIGLGTYLGEPDDAADTNYVDAVTTALQSGINMLDTAINYRHQRSERNIGAALAKLVSAGEITREEVFIATKAGYLSFDGNVPSDPRGYFMREYIGPGILDPDQIAAGMHCMAPKYLEDQIARSRRNLNVDTIDLFYVHNPETQLQEVARDVFRERLESAFEMLEQQVEERKIRFYGVATWSGFRVPSTSTDYLDLFEMSEFARKVGGNEHHFRFIQLPFNLAMPEAYLLANQETGEIKVPAIHAANRHGIGVVTSATLSQGHLAYGLPKHLLQKLGTQTDAETAIQFSRSTPGLTTSLVGMGHREHVAANLKALSRPPVGEKLWHELFAPE
jgi:aryl-alcohol dehydrogenase-like predicted oxidoreductase